jgi:hypothetical protein
MCRCRNCFFWGSPVDVIAILFAVRMCVVHSYIRSWVAVCVCARQVEWVFQQRNGVGVTDGERRPCSDVEILCLHVCLDIYVQ